MPRITIIGDRFIIVEATNDIITYGLTTLLRQVAKRMLKLSFDVIPSSLIDNILIFKTSNWYPADFTGGFVKITTKNMPEKLYQYRLRIILQR